MEDKLIQEEWRKRFPKMSSKDVSKMYGSYFIFSTAYRLRNDKIQALQEEVERLKGALSELYSASLPHRYRTKGEPRTGQNILCDALRTAKAQLKGGEYG